MGWLPQPLPHSHRPGVDFEPEGEIPFFFSFTNSCTVSGCTFPAYMRSDVVRRKSSNPEILHKSPLYRNKTASSSPSKTLGRAQQAHDGFFLSCKRQLLPSLAEEKPRSPGKLCPFLVLCCPWALVRFLKHLLVAVCSENKQACLGSLLQMWYLFS